MEKWREAVDQGEMDAFSALYAPEALLLVPLSPEPVKGREAIQKYESTISSAFPGATLRLTRPIVRDDTVAVEWEYSGTNTGPLTTAAGVQPATHRHVSLRGASVLRFSPKGLIAEEHRYYDSRSLFQQLGLE
ncbi:MAG: nuclear transport factor 2 family protein [Euryarchaeota archaeon]|nr:nuclear transport factor 2 family protein [Euryarchaeota archaeon]